MAELNEAYAVLSNAKSRREYDDQLRLECVLASKTAAKSAAEARLDRTRTSTGKAHHTRIQHRHEVDSTVFTQFSGHLRESFLGNKRFSWRAAAFEGFDWGLQALTWSACYCVALRCLASIDSAKVKTIISYSEMAITRSKRPIRKNHFLVVLPFLQMNEWEAVSSQIQSFLGGKNRAARNRPSTGVILMDMHHGRMLRLGRRFPDRNFEELIRSMRTSV